MNIIDYGISDDELRLFQQLGLTDMEFRAEYQNGGASHGSIDWHKPETLGMSDFQVQQFRSAAEIVGLCPRAFTATCENAPKDTVGAPEK